MLSFRCNLRIYSIAFAQVIIAIYLAVSPLVAQGPQGALMQPPESFSMNTNEMYQMGANRKVWVVAGRVMTLEGNEIKDARVLVSPLAGGQYRMFKTNDYGEFETKYRPKVGYIANYKVQLTVSKKGFKTAHVLLNLGDYPKPVRFPITLLPNEHDSSLLSQQALNSDLFPKLQSLGPSDGISAKSEKEYARGVHEFVGKGRPDRSLQYFSNVARSNAACAKCRTMLALAEFESGNWDGAARDDESAIKLTAKDQRTGSPESMVLAGVMESWMRNPKAATNFFLRAHKLDPKDALALQEIGRAQLQLREYESADTYLSRALAAGAGPEARLLRVEALLGEDSFDEANTEMNRYMNGRKEKAVPLAVRRIWLAVQARKEIDTLYASGGKRKSKRKYISPIDYLHDTARQLKGLAPAKDQSKLKPILTAVGKNIAALFKDFQNTTSLEKIHMELLRRDGKIANSLNEKFHYLCLMPSDPDVPGFTEYRQKIDPDDGPPGNPEKRYMLTSGFVSAALIFYPTFQSQSKFRYLGRQRMDGRESYVIAFAQLPLKTELVGMFSYGDKSMPTFEQGLAWIDTQNDQIVRLRTDLLRPLPKIRLKEETTQIDYQDVHFKKLAQGFWLPRDVTVTVAWNGKKLRNVHQYSGFRLFDVGHSEKITNPKPNKAKSKDLPESKAHHK